MMFVTSLMMAAAFQAAAPLPADPKPAPWPDEVRLRDRGEFGEPTADALRAVETLGGCIADKSTDKAAEMLGSDFTSKGYGRAMDRLIDANYRCPETRGWWRLATSRLLLAGTIAERMVERQGVPVNNLLARAAGQAATKSFSPSDAGAICVVRSAPDEVGKLFATSLGTPEEAATAAPLLSLLPRCMNGAAVETSVRGLRAILATAAYRSVAALPAKSN